MKEKRRRQTEEEEEYVECGRERRGGLEEKLKNVKRGRKKLGRA